MSAPAKAEGMNSTAWQCFHCDELFTDEAEAREHFGANERADAACRIKARDGGLLGALRNTEADLATWRLRAVLAEEQNTSAECVREEYGRYFQRARSAWEAFCLYDTMEGRALAAEERLTQLATAVGLTEWDGDYDALLSAVAALALRADQEDQ